MAQSVSAGVFLSAEDCARLDGLLLRALADSSRRDGGVPVQVERIAAELHHAALKFRASVQVDAGSGTSRDRNGSAARTSVVTDRLSVTQAAGLAGVSEGYMRRLVRRGCFTATRSGQRGAGWLLDGGQVAAWAAERNRRQEAA